MNNTMERMDVVSLNPKASVKIPVMNGPVPCHHIEKLSPTAFSLEIALFKELQGQDPTKVLKGH